MITGLIRRFLSKEAKKEKRKRRLERQAEEMFDVKYTDKMWLTCNGIPVVPFCILVKNDNISECSALISTIRKLYVESNL